MRGGDCWTALLDKAEFSGKFRDVYVLHSYEQVPRIGVRAVRKVMSKRTRSQCRALRRDALFQETKTRSRR